MSTTTGSSTCSSRRATSSDQVDYATKDPSDLFLGQPDGSFVQAAEAAGIVDFARGRGAALADLNLDGLPDLVEVFYDAPVRCGGTKGRPGPRRAPAANAHWLDVQAGSAGAECRRDRVVGRSPGRRQRSPGARSRSAAVTSAASSAGSTSGSARPTRPTSASLAGRDGRAVAARHGRPVRDRRSSAAGQVRPWTPAG